MQSKLSVRISSKPCAARSAGQVPTAAKYALLAAAATDVERKKHKKNPFDDRYVELCLTSFTEVCRHMLSARSQLTSDLVLT